MKLNKNDIENRGLKNTRIKKLFIIFIAICLIWTIFFSTDYILVTKFWKRPLFSINVKTDYISGDGYSIIDHTRREYVGIGYSFSTRSYARTAVDIYYAKIRLFNKEIRTFHKGGTV